MRKIVLFSAHSPLSGGGGGILRSLVASLADLDINWTYTNSFAAKKYEQGYLGPGLLGGPLLKDGISALRLLNGTTDSYLDHLVGRLLALDCDAFWVVSHNEGLRIALELARRQSSRPVHLTVHDDWAGALCARSMRYRILAPYARRLTGETLKEVSSFDVISEGMRSFYEQCYGLRGEVCHRHIPVDNLPCLPLPFRANDGVFLTGHIGSIYRARDLWSFAEILETHARRVGRRAVLRLWGCHLQGSDVPASLKRTIELCPSAPEIHVVEELRKCDLLYAMYPLSRRLRLFGETSLPTKLTTYVQVGRPILGHGPAGSTLTRFLEQTQLGETWTNNDSGDGIKAIEGTMARTITHASLEQARSHYFGENNVATMRRVLTSPVR